MNVLKNKTEKRQREQTPKYPEKLAGSFWGIATFYNPNKYENKIRNYNEFRKSSKKQGLKLLCIELAFQDSKFELKKGDADILIQLRTKGLLWQKERLINIGLKYLPKDCDKFAWLDSDVIFQNNDWINQTCNLLESYIVVQPFSYSVLLPRDYKIDSNKSFSNKPSPKNRKKEKYYGVAYGVVHLGKKILESEVNRYRLGLVWAARRESFDKNKLYDRFIIGGADGFMAYAFYGSKNYFMQKSSCYSPKMIEDQSEWLDRIYKDIKGSVYYTEGLVLHLWHGKRENRFYKSREQILKKHNFNPKTDIKIDKQGCWVWAADKPKLHRSVKKYFWMRNEEGSFFRELILFFYRCKEENYLLKQEARLKEKIYLLKHKMLSKIGIFLKKYYPKLYFRLKKIKKN